MTDLSALSEPNPLRDAMMEAALKAAATAIACGRDGLTTQTKSDGSCVTNGDLQAEQVILQQMNHYAAENRLGADQFRFLGEESPAALAGHLATLDVAECAAIVARNKTVGEWQQDEKGLYLIIDPIDGTGNYTRSCHSVDEHGQPHEPVPNEQKKPWAVSIALQHDGKTIASAVYEAAVGESAATIGVDGKVSGLKGKLYWAEKGKGAYIIDCGADATAQRLYCDPKLPVASGSIAYIEHFIPDSDAKRLPPTQVVQGPLYQSQAEVSNGADVVCDDLRSACVSALHVAAGEDHKSRPLCAFSHGYACPWDWAAVSLVLQETGVPVLIADAGKSTVKPDTPPLVIMLTARNTDMAQQLIGNYQQALAAHYPDRPAGEAYVCDHLNGVVEYTKPATAVKAMEL